MFRLGGGSGHPPAPGPHAGLVIGVTALMLLGIGWFMLFWRVMHQSAGDAVSDAIGAMFGLLIVVSVIGVIRQHRGKGR